MKLNLGCGSDIHGRMWNVDVVRRPGVDEVVDLEKTPWPWADAAFDYILARGVFEHINRFDAAWHEVHRILSLGGLIDIAVAYRNTWDPFHHSLWSRKSVEDLCNGYATSVQGNGPAFSRVGSVRLVNNGGFPWWHMRKHIGVEPPPVPGVHRVMEFTLRKIQ